MTKTPSNEDRDGEPVGEPIIDETRVFKPGTFRYFGESFDPGRSEIISSTNADDSGAPTNEHSGLRAYREGQEKLPTPSNEEPTVQTPSAAERRAADNERYKRLEQLRYAAMRFRVYHIPQVPMKAIRIQCNSLATAMGLVDTLAQYDLFQLHHRVKPDFCNASGIEYYDHADKEWYEFDVRDELEDYREAMMSPAVLGLADAEPTPIPGWHLEPGQAMFVEEWR